MSHVKAHTLQMGRLAGAILAIIRDRYGSKVALEVFREAAQRAGPIHKGNDHQ